MARASALGRCAYSTSMLDWLARLRKPRLAPLAGAPTVRRQKTYSAQSGYVYQYFYLGTRPATRDKQEGGEYVFEVSADRKTSFPVSVFLGAEAVGPWVREHQRELSSTERYAIAKMALFQAFDERSTPEMMRQEVLVRSKDLTMILETLDLD